jgi:riboflavin synthase
MPLRLEDPRKGKSPNYRIRGTYLGIAVDRSARTSERKVAAKELKKIKSDIESGRYAEPDAVTFAGAARDYLKAGGDATHLERLLLHFGTLPIDAIDQAAIDSASLQI